MDEERLYQVALTRVPHVGCVIAKALIEKFKSATEVFKASAADLELVEGVGTGIARSLSRFRDFRACEKILNDVEQYKLSMIFLNDEAYPKKLLDCYDPPTLLYYKGNISLNAPKKVAVIGTRSHSEYGRQVTEKLIRDLRDKDITIVSGMAYGIDGLAHRNAIKYDIPTIGVLAHGLNTIYPSEHTSMAREMLRGKGALVTEFIVGTKPDRHNFPIRNRIVAGICDAIVVVETGLKGGSMITASIAASYNHPVFVFPGRTTDNKNAGCNMMLRRNTATIILDADNLLEELQWELPKDHNRKNNQLSFFGELNTAEATIVNLLGIHGQLAIDELYLRSGLNSGAAASAILNLEIRNIIKSLPGKQYRMV